MTALATLKSTVAQTKVREAEMEFAKTTYVRWRDSPPGVVSEQERESKKADFDSAEARYKASLADVNSAQGRVDNLKALEGFKLLVAPFDGVVTQRNTDIGALINAGSSSGAGGTPQLFRVADVHEMRVFVQVPQEISSPIHPGMTAELCPASIPESDFQGRGGDDLRGDQRILENPDGRAPRGQREWPPAARHLHGGAFRAAQ